MILRVIYLCKIVATNYTNLRELDLCNSWRKNLGINYLICEICEQKTLIIQFDTVQKDGVCFGLLSNFAAKLQSYLADDK